MSITYSHLEHPGHTIPFQSMGFDYDGSRHGQSRANRQYRLPPPHSSIPIGLIVDDDRGGLNQPSERTDVSSPESDLTPRREQLPSVHQLLSEGNSSYLPPPPPPHSDRFHGRSLRDSPSVHPRSLESRPKSSRKPEVALSEYGPMSSTSNRDYERYRTPQPARLPPISQVGIEPSHSRVVENSRSQRGLDDDSPRSQSVSMDPSISPGRSGQNSPYFVSSPRQEGSQNGLQAPLLPNQVVDERYLPGKGVCYIFADNSYCPKLIDGQPVNPSWGLTKAGKARKRLAQACIPCREKKVKCQPNLPKCDQCQKSGRECKFESAPRGSRARSSSYDLQPV